MIQQKGSWYVLICDNCGDEHYERFNSWDDAVKEKRSIGWKSKKINGDWEDWCEDCNKQR